MPELDPGIVDIVRLVQAHGFVTTDSGDGVSKPPAARAFNVPHVVCRVDEPQRLVNDAHRLWTVFPLGWRVEASYTPHDRIGLLVATNE